MNKIGFAMTSSYCTLEKAIEQLENLVEKGYDVHPITSPDVIGKTTRFGCCKQFKNRIENITEKPVVSSIVEAEKFGPLEPLDAIIVAPATGNTVAKLTNGITDTPVTMAVKATLRNEKPVVLAIATNDALGANGPNIISLYYRKNYFLVPITQDDPIKKPNSMIADFNMIEPTLEYALNNSQIDNAITKDIRVKMLSASKKN